MRSLNIEPSWNAFRGCLGWREVSSFGSISSVQSLMSREFCVRRRNRWSGSS
ncbi:hypothetical protein [Dolichospermum phage Dfl-JY45]